MAESRTLALTKHTSGWSENVSSRSNHRLSNGWSWKFEIWWAVGDLIPCNIMHTGMARSCQGVDIIAVFEWMIAENRKSTSWRVSRWVAAVAPRFGECLTTHGVHILFSLRCRNDLLVRACIR